MRWRSANGARWRRRGSTRRRAAVATLCAALLGLAVPAQAGERPPDPASEAEQVLREVAGSRSASWLLRSWERKGDEVEVSESRCRWTAPDRLELQVVAGRGKGARIVARGGHAKVTPPGLLRWMTLDLAVDSPKLRSLRGRTPRDADLVALARGLLDELQEARTSRGSDGRIVLEVGVRESGSRIEIQRSGGSFALRLERLEGGRPVERIEYLDIETG